VVKQEAFHDRTICEAKNGTLFSVKDGSKLDLHTNPPRQAKHVSEITAWVLCAMAFTVMARSEVWAA
jgi:hypothetical protein